METTLDATRLEAFTGQMLKDLGTTISGALVYLGDRLGLYRALAGAGPSTSEELAERTGTAERYVREWLGNQAAAGYVVYDPVGRAYSLPPEHAAVLAEESSPSFMAGGFTSAVAVFQILDRMEEVFRTGEGVAWHEHDDRLFCGTERFFGPAYRTHLVSEWIPALDGVKEALERGAHVADVGCGHGSSTVLMAEAFPASTFTGFDVHRESIDTAGERARDAGLDGRVRFECASASEFSGPEYDLITFFDCLHDMGDPVGAATHARECLAEGGTLMVVEPKAGDRVEDNLHPVGQTYYGFSTLVCTPASLAQEGRCGLGAQAGEARLREILSRAGFGRIRCAVETPVNLILEARV